MVILIESFGGSVSSPAAHGSRHKGRINHHHNNNCSDSVSLRQITVIEEAIKDKFNGVNILKTLFDKTSSGIGTWLQIGANTLDPKQNYNDPLMKIIKDIPMWSKFFVEPIPVLYDQLKENIKIWPNSTAINAAIGVNPDTSHIVEYLSMYCLKKAMKDKDFEKKENIAHWANQICSFSESHVKSHFPDDEAVAFNVTTMSPSLLMHTYNITSLDVLMIDTEGFDFKVLQNFPFAQIRPSIVMYESFHLWRYNETEAAEKFMRSHCYALFKWGENMFGMSV
jgi:FkbM family methyltransferase